MLRQSEIGTGAAAVVRNSDGTTFGRILLADPLDKPHALKVLLFAKIEAR